MKYHYNFFTLFLMLVFLSVQQCSFALGSLSKASLELSAIRSVKDADQNIALSAVVTTSFVSPWETLGAVNNNIQPTSSTKDQTAYGNWNGEENYNTYNWVQYEWTSAQQISSTNIYWWSDGGGISQPTDAYISYWDGVEWVKAGTIGKELNIYNTLQLNFLTKKIRINMVSLTSTGILQWQVMGAQGPACNATLLTPYVQVDTNPLVQSNFANVLISQTLHLSVESKDSGRWVWTGPKGFTASTAEVTLTNIQSDQAGAYTVTFINSCGETSVQTFPITVLANNNGDSYIWPSYTPTLNYNFKQEFPDLAEPTKDLDDCPDVVGTQSSGWWTFKWGPNAKKLVTSAAITPLLARLNKDFAYFRDVMGWPPDKRAKEGYRSAVYLFGSGLKCIDSADSTELGGWQSAIGDYPCILASYYPIYSFDPACTYNDKESQMGAMVHEGIHAVLADLPGAKNSAWFQEGGNTWLQQEAAATQSGDYSSMGFLNGCAFIAPFMPIECYSGWLQDGSFGGPSAEGVNMTNDAGNQVCTWRKFLGGTQYGNTFPVFLGTSLGKGSVPWIWRHCKSRVLEGMADSLGDTQVRRLIAEYRAKQAVIDFGVWTVAVKKLLNDDFKMSIGAEWQPSWLSPDTWMATPYVKTIKDSNGVLIPESRTTPGWSGANQIPLHVTGNSVTVNFQPIGSNMTCQLCYRTKDGEIVYSQLVYGGDCTLKLDKTPANGVVFAVISNTDYVYNGEETRKAHFDYRLKPGVGVEGTADIYMKWYDWTSDIVDITGLQQPIQLNENEATIYPNPIDYTNGELNIKFNSEITNPIIVKITDLKCRIVFSTVMKNSIKINTQTILESGIYIVTLESSQKKTVYNYKLVVK